MNALSRVPGSDDEEDLDALRIAALQSLKRKDGPDSVGSQCKEHNMFDNSNNFRLNKVHRNKKGRFFPTFPGRGGKHTHFNRDFNRSRNANLISIATIPSEEDCEKKQSELNAESKDDTNSKFSRYDNSDKSESESEEDDKVKEKSSPGKLERANSLEALMLELDNEILGKPEEVDQNLDLKKDSDRTISESDTSLKSNSEEKCTENSEKDQKPASDTSSENPVIFSPTKIENERKNHRQFNHMRRKRVRSRSPSNRRFFHRQPPPPQLNMFNEIPVNPPPPLMFGPPMQFQQQPFVPFPNPPFNPFAPPVINMPNPLPQPFYNRPLSPLAINAESLTTATLAPLSPRSAAFVLENKAIVERRRRSPRRSYSRSLSRSPRRLSISPRRSPISPRRSPLSPRRSPISPRRISRSPRRSPRRRSLSPRRRSMSPIRRSVSPRRRKIVRNDPPPKGRLAVRERLGLKNTKVEQDKEKTAAVENESPKDGVPSQKKDEKKEDKILDPVLEARRKKFETNEIKKKEGIIRLKPKEDNRESTSTPVTTTLDKPNVNKKSPTVTSTTASLPVKTSNLKVKTQEKDKKIEKEEPVKKVLPTRRTEERIVKKEDVNKEEKAKKEVVKTVKTPERTLKVDKIKEEPKEKVKVPDEFEELEKLLNENPLPEIDEILQPKVADIFSDEDSGSDNEGRFKVNKKGSAKIAVIPFTKLASSTGTDIKPNLTLPGRNDRHKRHQSSNESRYRRRSRSRLDEKRRSPKREPVKEEPKKKESHDKLHVKNRVTVKSERYTPPIDRKFERKIEIKIKNPSKYEKSEKSWSPPAKTVEKVEIKKEIESEDDDVKEVEIDEIEPEIIVENDSEDEENTTSEGDLRAQLSKKRAEKLHRIPVVSASSRLIQCALESAVYKRAKKKKSKDKKESLKKDVRVPIHLRLGIANSSDIFSESPVKRKSRKRKSREVLEQV